jgi:hypothetical protein
LFELLQWLQKIQRRVRKGTASKRKCLTLKILQKLKIIRRLEGGRNQREVMASYNTVSSTVYDIKKEKDHL